MAEDVIPIQAVAYMYMYLLVMAYMYFLAVAYYLLAMDPAMVLAAHVHLHGYSWSRPFKGCIYVCDLAPTRGVAHVLPPIIPPSSTRGVSGREEAML